MNHEIAILAVQNEPPTTILAVQIEPRRPIFFAINYCFKTAYKRQKITKRNNI